MLWLTGNPVLAVNVVSLLSCVLCGLGAYVLGRRVGLSPAAAALTGLVFAFSPPRFFRFSQLHLAAVQWIPFTLASLHAYLDGGRKRDLRLAVAFFTLQVLTSGHGGVFAAVAILLLLGVSTRARRAASSSPRCATSGIAGALLLVPVVLFVIPYRMSQVEVGLRRVLDAAGTPLQKFLRVAHTRGCIPAVADHEPGHQRRGDRVACSPGFCPFVLALVAVRGGDASWRLGCKQRQAHGRRCHIEPATIATAAPNPQRRFVLRDRRALVAPPRRRAVTLARRRRTDSAVYGDDRVVWTGYLSVEQCGPLRLRHHFR